MSDIAPEDSDSHLGTIGKKVAKGAALITIGGVIVRLIGLVNTLLLARILVPADFGLVAIGITVMQILENFSEISVSRTVVRFREGGRSLYDTLFTLSMLKGLLVFTVMAIAAPIAQRLYGDERIVAIFLVLGATALLRSFMNPKFYEFERDIDFSREFIVNLVNKVIAVAVSVAIALIFRTYWAIVLGMTTGVAVNVILSYMLRPHMPRISFSSFRQVFGFMGWVTVVGAAIAVNNKFAVLIIGRVLGAAPNGAFYVGNQLSELPGRELAQPIARALYPGLSSLQDNAGHMKRAFLKGGEALGAVALPACFGLGFVAQDFTTLVLGEGWDLAAFFVAVLTPIYGFMAIYSSTEMLALAASRVRLVFIREVIVMLVQFPLMIYWGHQYGYPGAVAAVALGAVVYILLQGWIYQRITKGAWWEPLWAARRSLIGVAAMSAWFLAVRPLIPQLDDLPIFIRLVIDVALGGLIYMAAVIAAWFVEGRPESIEVQALGMAGIKLSR